MKINLTCTQAQFEALSLAAHTGRSRHVAVPRQALKELLLDHGRMYRAATRFVDVIDPSPKERAVMVEGRDG